MLLCRNNIYSCRFQFACKQRTAKFAELGRNPVVHQKSSEEVFVTSDAAIDQHRHCWHFIRCNALRLRCVALCVSRPPSRASCIPSQEQVQSNHCCCIRDPQFNLRAGGFCKHDQFIWNNNKAVILKLFLRLRLMSHEKLICTKGPIGDREEHRDRGPSLYDNGSPVALSQTSSLMSSTNRTTRLLLHIPSLKAECCELYEYAGKMNIYVADSNAAPDTLQILK